MRSPRDYGVLGDLTTGCLGAVVGGWLLRRLHVWTPEDLVGHVLIALIGAVVLLAGVRLVRHLSAAVGVVTPSTLASSVGDLDAQLRRPSPAVASTIAMRCSGRGGNNSPASTLAPRRVTCRQRCSRACSRTSSLVCSDGGAEACSVIFDRVAHAAHFRH